MRRFYVERLLKSLNEIILLTKGKARCTFTLITGLFHLADIHGRLRDGSMGTRLRNRSIRRHHKSTRDLQCVPRTIVWEDHSGERRSAGVKYCSPRDNYFVYNSRTLTKPRVLFSFPLKKKVYRQRLLEQAVKSAAKPSNRFFPINGQPTKIGNKPSGKAILVHRCTSDVGMNNPLGGRNLKVLSALLECQSRSVVGNKGTDLHPHFPTDFSPPLRTSTPPSSTGRQPPEAPLPLTAGRIPPPPGSGAYGRYSSSLRTRSCNRVSSNSRRRSRPTFTYAPVFSRMARSSPAVSIGCETTAVDNGRLAYRPRLTSLTQSPNYHSLTRRVPANCDQSLNEIPAIIP
ncbi:hypothetical protein EAG_03306 [Camponotus floridanus]|uniref:Uncharacterized protein n=1 Tax=Camponotus floridanus TaxID=104421 RepID=E2ANR4_CAMFO|nr:hypothetical protein EAG_03306 [Camponotus floridanus]